MSDPTVVSFYRKRFRLALNMLLWRDKFFVTFPMIRCKHWALSYGSQVFCAVSCGHRTFAEQYVEAHSEAKPRTWPPQGSPGTDRRRGWATYESNRNEEVQKEGQN